MLDARHVLQDVSLHVVSKANQMIQSCVRHRVCNNNNLIRKHGYLQLQLKQLTSKMNRITDHFKLRDVTDRSSAP